MGKLKGKNTTIDRNQSKITHFFRKEIQATSFKTNNSAASLFSSASRLTQAGVSRGQPRVIKNQVPIGVASESFPTKSPNNYQNDDDADDDDDDILEVIEVEKPPPSPKPLVIISSDSESEEPEGKVNCPILVKSEKQPDQVLSKSTIPAVEPSPDSGDGGDQSAFVSATEQADQEGGANHHDAAASFNLDRSGTFQDDNGSSSGDEILSQIDFDEVIRSSQSSMSDSQCPNKALLLTPSKENGVEHSASERLTKLIESTPGPTTSSSMKKSPPKSPKSQINKFSPIRHLRMKRTSSEASLGSPSKVVSDHLSPHKLDASGSRSPKKKLNFGSAVATKSIPAGGGRYYLRNFMSILSEVIGDDFHAHLVSDDDHKMVQRFTALSLDAQSLYVRLFQRKWGWKPLDKLVQNYDKEFADLLSICEELFRARFFDKIPVTDTTLEDVLDTLDLPKLTTLAKKMKLNPPKKTKEMLKEAMLAQANQRTLSGSSGSSPMMKQALSVLGPAFRVSVESKTLFSRLFILYSPPQYWEVESDQAANQLLVVLLNSKGQMEFPSYRIRKEKVIFRTRDDLIRFHEAFSMHSDVVAFSEAKDWNEVVQLANDASMRFQSLLNTSDIVCHDSNLPSFLRIFTAGSALCHTCWMGVDGFQKQKKFAEANALIETLLGQQVYLPNYRGRMWERLAINQGHLKRSKEEIKQMLEKSLQDSHLRPNHRLILSQRLEKINSTISNAALAKKRLKKQPVSKALKKFEESAKPSTRSRRGGPRKVYVDDSDEENGPVPQEICDPDAETQKVFVPPEKNSSDETENNAVVVETLTLKFQVPTRTITGEKMDRGPGNMGKAVFISRKDSTGSNRMSSVEQHAIDYYITCEGFSNGIHGEGSTICTIYGLLFWDVIFYDDLPDAFHTRYQGFPLDLHFEDFYLRRRNMIEEKLTIIRSLTVDELFEIVEHIRENNFNKLSIVNWSLVEDPEKLKTLMKAMGPEMIADFCERLSRNYRYFHSGFPDIVVWAEEKVLFVEVKGPGDSLSPKQQLWLEWMLEKGIPCEVCHVKSVSNKRIRSEETL